MNSYLKILLVLLSALLFGCAGPKQVANVDTEVVVEETVDESFDPASLNDYVLDIKPKKKQATDVLDIDKFLAGGAQADTLEENEEIPGFRVQLVATRSVDEARAVKREALLVFDEIVYLTFDDPYYKVRVGDAVSRFEANELQELAIQKGYVGAWVVRSLVKRRPGMQPKEVNLQPQ